MVRREEEAEAPGASGGGRPRIATSMNSHQHLRGGEGGVG